MKIIRFQPLPWPPAIVLLILLAGLFVSTASARIVKINAAASRIRVQVYKSGLLSAFADNHTIAAPLASGSLDFEKRAVELRFNVNDMKVVDSGTSASDRAQVERNMKGEKVLDAARFPEIKFVSTSVEKQSAENYLVHGNLSLHGKSKIVDIPVSWKGGHYYGSVKLRQTDFAITPIRIAAGAVKVKDVVTISFDIATE